MLDVVFEAANQPMSITDIHGRFVEVNPAYCAMFGYTREELIGKEFTMVLSADTRKYAAGLHREFMQGLTEENSGEWKVIDSLGQEKEVYMTEGRLFAKSGECYKITTLTDITERKKKADHLQKALQEKDQLISQIHHHTKNDLNMVAGLLFLQSEKLRNQPVLFGSLQASINRIKAIALAHEQLHRQEDHFHIDFEAYVKVLCHNLQAACGSDAKNTSLQLQTEKIMLHIDKAIACGLILNEVLGQLLKNVGNTGQAVEIILSVARHDRQIVVTVTAQGLHQYEDSNFQTHNNLSMQLIGILSDQLNAEVAMEVRQGMHLQLNFRA